MEELDRTLPDPEPYIPDTVNEDVDDTVTLSDEQLAAARDLNNRLGLWYSIPKDIGNSIKYGFIIYMAVDILKHIIDSFSLHPVSNFVCNCT